MNPKDIIKKNLDTLRVAGAIGPEPVFKRADTERSVMVHPEDGSWIADMDGECFNYNQSISDDEFINRTQLLLSEVNSGFWGSRRVTKEELDFWSDNRCETVVNALWPEKIEGPKDIIIRNLKEVRATWGIEGEKVYLRNDCRRAIALNPEGRILGKVTEEGYFPAHNLPEEDVEHIHMLLIQALGPIGRLVANPVAPCDVEKWNEVKAANICVALFLEEIGV